MLLNTYIINSSADTAKAALGMEKIRKLKVFIPKIELQNEFAAFVEQVDKSKFVNYSRYFLWEFLTLFSSTIAYSSVVSILA